MHTGDDTSNYLRSVLLIFFISFAVIALVRLLFPGYLLFESIFLSGAFVSIAFLMIRFRSFKRIQQSYWISVLLAFSLVLNSGFLVLMNIDRSRSFYVLIWCQDKSSFSKIESKSIMTFGSVEVDGIRQRLEEQETRKLIKRTGSTYEVTTTGRSLIFISNILANIFSLKNYQRVRDIDKT